MSKKRSAHPSDVWVALVVIGTAWGFLAGIAFARDMWLDPGAALFGLMGVGVLVLTTAQLSRKRR